MEYPEHAGHAAGSATSSAAADNAERRGKVTRELTVYRALAASPMTCLELCERLQLPNEVISPRVYEMAARGLVAPTGETRETNYGNQANVYGVILPYSRKAQKTRAVDPMIAARKMVAEVVMVFGARSEDELEYSEQATLDRCRDFLHRHG